MSERAKRALEELQERLVRILPQWKSRGPEDPLWVLMESFALKLAEMQNEVESLPDKLLARCLTALGEEAHWPQPARTVLHLVPRGDAERATRVPPGTGITASRGRAIGQESSRPRLHFETCGDAWVSPARLETALVVDRERVAELPVETGATVPGAMAEQLFTTVSPERHLYLGDSAWGCVRRRQDDVVIEWPGAPGPVVEGLWEYGAASGWRRLPAEFTEAASATGGRLLRMRIPGPLPDMAERRIEGAVFPWLRMSVPGSRRLTLPVPRVAWLPPKHRKGRSGVPRAVARVLSRAGSRWEDHSFESSGRVAAAQPDGEECPVIYLGWDRPLPATVFWRAEGTAAPPGFEAPRWVWEFSAADGFQPANVRDETRGLSAAGVISWGVLKGWTATEQFGRSLFWLRARWTEGHFYSPPRVRGILPGAVEVVEGRTLTSAPLRLSFSGDGPRGRLETPLEGEIEPFETLELMLAGGEMRRLRRASADEELSPETFRLHRLADGEVEVEIEGPSHAVLEARTEMLRAGLRFSREPLPAGTLDVVEADLPDLERLEQPATIAAGVRAESPSDLRRRAREEWRCGGRAVTVEDFARLVRAVDPDVARVEVVGSSARPDEWTIVLVPFPPFTAGRIPVPRLAWIERYLQPKVPLGTVVRAVEPCFVPCRLRLVMSPGAADFDFGTDKLESELRAFLDPLQGGDDGAGYPMGKGLRPEDVENIIGRLLEGRPSGRDVTVEIDDSGRRDREEPAEFVATGFPALEEISVAMSGKGNGTS